MANIESASAATAIQDSVGNAEIEMENSALNDIENQYKGLVNHIEGMLEGVKSTSSTERCIFRVPIAVRKINEAAYTPRIVSIGPFHHGSEGLQSMEAEKLRYFDKLIKRGVRLKDYVKLVKENEQKIHRCYGGDDFAETYSNKLPRSGDDFLTMILVDAGFIIELLLTVKSDKCKDKNDSSFNDWILNGLDRDLMLLENQLPFFILKELFDLTFAHVPNKPCSLLKLAFDFFRDFNEQNEQNGQNGQNCSLLKLALDFFRDFNGQNEQNCSLLKLPLDFFRDFNGQNEQNGQNKQKPNSEVCHFTDLIRTLYLPTSERPPRTRNEFKFLHTATELHEAGVTFRAGSSKCLLDIKFTKGVLEIPCFRIHPTTIPYFLNLMALELRCYPDDSYIIDYFAFMDFLINTPKDVDLLVRSGILLNWCSDSGEAAAFFNSLCTETTMNYGNFYFSSLCEKLNAYYKDRKHTWKAILKRDYCTNPCRTASTIAAIILLVLTFIQTVCSILSLEGV